MTPIQMARFYAMIANGGKLVTPHIAEDVELTGDRRPAGAACCARFGAQQPSRPASTRPRSQYVQEGLYAGDALAARHLVRRLRQVPDRRSPARRVRPRRTCTLPGYPNPLKLNQSWWCGYGPYDRPSIVVCAVIENGGHGGDAAAPAALKVFEQYFDKHGDHDPHAATDDD